MHRNYHYLSVPVDPADVYVLPFAATPEAEAEAFLLHCGPRTPCTNSGIEQGISTGNLELALLRRAVEKYAIMTVMGLLHP